MRIAIDVQRHRLAGQNRSMTDKGVPEGAAECQTEPSLGDRVPRIPLIITIAFIAVAFSLVWFASLHFLNTSFWGSDFVIANRWMIPVGVLFFSLLVGLCGKYLRAPNVINGLSLIHISEPT